ncbi:MAG TPA: hypothetical protein VGM24_06885 [Puia sp.]
MEEPFLTFRKFNDPAMASEMAGRLREHGIPVEIEDSGKLFDPSFAHNYLDQDIRLKLRARDFGEADGIMQSFYESQVHRVGEDYYLYQFSNSELLEIVRNPDEWGYLDYMLAQKILSEHGISIPSRELKRFQNEKIKLLSEPEHADKSWTYMGYLLALLFPPLGMIIGASMGFMKKTLPDGQRRFAYSESDRKQGKQILIISEVCLVPWVWLWLRGWKI